MDIRQDNDIFAQHFGLSHNPFSATGRFPFFRVRRREVLEQLVHFSRFTEVVLAVTGPRGSGKTVLRHAVAAVSKETALNVVVSGLKNSDAAGIAQELANALQCTNADIMSLLHAVEQSVLAGKDVQLLVDNAEALDASALALLQRLSVGNGETRCKIFLFGEPALQTLLQDQDGQENRLEYHLVELEPWQEEEVEEYLQQRLQAAGGDLDLFSDAELAILLDQGQGWPGVINQLAQELLLERMQQSEEAPAVPVRKAGKLALPRRHLVALVAVALLFILIWSMLDDGKGKQQQQAPQPAAVTESLAEGRPAAQKRIALELPASEPAAAVEPKPVASAPARTQEPVVSPPAVSEPVVNNEPVAVVPAPAPKTEPQPPAAPAAQKARPAVQPTPVKVPVKPAEPPKPKTAAAVAQRKAANAGNWYAAQPAQGYTLQLFATSSEQKARKFVQANGSQFHYFRKMHQGQQLFVVTHGRFNDAATARAAVERLPESLRRNKPWPRTFDSIRREMR